MRTLFQSSSTEELNREVSQINLRSENESAASAVPLDNNSSQHEYFKEFMKLIRKQKEPPVVYTAFNSSISFINEEFIKSLNLPTDADKVLTFKDLGIHTNTIELLKNNGITKPLDVQARSIPLISDNKSVIIESATGSGKTLTFLLPILQDMGEKACSNIIIVPTRELASQIYKEAVKYASDKSLITRHVSGVNEEYDTDTKRALRYSKLLIGTPKKLLEIIEKNTGYFQNTRRIVLDEVDKLLPLKSFKRTNISKVKATEKILSIVNFYQRKLQLIATSATISKHLIDELQYIGFTKKCKIVKLIPENYHFGYVPENIKHTFAIILDNDSEAKLKVIHKLFERSNEKSVLVFINRNESVEQVVDNFKELGLKSVALYKELLIPAPKSFEKFMDAFECGDVQVVVATEETVRGIDFPFVNQAYLTYIPTTPENYVHVAGRVGRSGQASKVTTLLNESDGRNEKRRLKKKYSLLGIKGKKLIV